MRKSVRVLSPVTKTNSLRVGSSLSHTCERRRGKQSSGKESGEEAPRKSFSSLAASPLHFAPASTRAGLCSNVSLHFSVSGLRCSILRSRLLARACTPMSACEQAKNKQRKVFSENFGIWSREASNIWEGK